MICPMDAIDRKMLAILQREGRITNAELAERLHLSPSPCLRRLRALERDGVISGYRAVLDRQQAGLGLTVFVELKVDGHSDRSAAAITDALQRARRRSSRPTSSPARPTSCSRSSSPTSPPTSG